MGPAAAAQPTPASTRAAQGCDFEAGTVCGTLEAFNVPDSDKPITTFFEGEIVDNVNHSFFTPDWGASAETDIWHWQLFKPFQAMRAVCHFGLGWDCGDPVGGWRELRRDPVGKRREMRRPGRVSAPHVRRRKPRHGCAGFDTSAPWHAQEVMTCGGRHPGLDRHRHLFMRWKEKFFVEGCECQLTIAGFYYICLDRCAAGFFEPLGLIVRGTPEGSGRGGGRRKAARHPRL